VDLRRRHVRIGDSSVVAYGHWGPPLLAFPAEKGQATDWEQTGMVDAIAPALHAGELKLFCVDSFDAWTWAAQDVPLEERARRHAAFEHWLVDHVVPWVQDDCGGSHDVALTGASLGAYHAANFTLRRADLFPRALCLSGVYDVTVGGWGERGDAVYFNNPLDYVANVGGDHLDWLRTRVRLTLVAGQGMWEDTTGALDSTRRFAALLGEKGIPHELDVWGHDVPHDWPSWQAQLVHHLPRLLAQ
jgi:esterase/lipase superfamily enzyme